MTDSVFDEIRTGKFKKETEYLRDYTKQMNATTDKEVLKHFESSKTEIKTKMLTIRIQMKMTIRLIDDPHNVHY